MWTFKVDKSDITGWHTKLPSGNILTLGTMDSVTDKCWMLPTDSPFPMRHSMQQHLAIGGKWLPIIKQTIPEFEGVPIETA